MISFARVFALAGVMLLILGAFLPTNRASNLEEFECTDGFLQESLISPDCLSEDAEAGFLVSSLGLVVVVVGLAGFVVALSPTPSRLWTLALTAVGVVGLLFVYQDASATLNLAGDFAWGWGVFGGAVVMLVLAALISTIRRTHVEVG